MKVLRKYQRVALRYSSKIEHPAFFIDMRLGKTTITIEDACRFKRKRNDIKQILVICPLSAFKGWKDDLTEKGERFSLLHDENFDRRLSKILFNGWNIINPGGIRAFNNRHKSIRDLIFKADIVIIDESTCIKNIGADITKICQREFRDAKRRYVLTGTPDAKSDIDFVNQLIFLDHNIFGNNFYAFKKNYCVPSGDGKTVIAKRARDWFMHTLTSYCFFLKKEDVNLQNEVIHTTRLCKMSKKLEKIYRRLEEEMVLQISEDEDSYIGLFHTLAKYLACRKIASGIVKDEFYENHKTDELIRLIEDLKGERLVVWANYKDEFKIIQEALEKNKITFGILHGDIKTKDRELVVSKFNSGESQILVVNPEIFKFGTDLSSANTMCYFSIPMSPETYLQANQRTYKVSKKEPTYIVYLLSDDTIDMDIYEGVRKNSSRVEFNHYIFKQLMERRKYAL